MSRWLKILLLVLVVAGIGLFSLPWWLGAVLRPVLQSKGVTFARYERAGYAHFRLHEVHFANASVEFTARQVQTLTPLVWLAKRLRGAEPAVAIDGWQVRRVAGPDRPSDTKLINGLPDLRTATQRIGPRVIFWLPRLQLSAGEVHGFGPDITIFHVNWQNSILTVDGLGLAYHRFSFVLSTTTDGSIVLTAHTAENDARLQLVLAGAEIKGEAVLWDQSLQLAARFPAQGWLPSEASAVAENWRLPATRVKLGAPYAQVSGSGRLIWRDKSFELSVNAKAEPAADTKAPPFEASAMAHGTLRELTLTALHIDAPFATAKLTAPVTFSLDRPLSAESAQLIVEADLAKQPWFEAVHGKVSGAVSVAGDTAAARQTFELKFSDILVRDFSIKEAQAGGVLAWPRLELTQLKVRLDETNSLEAHGAVNWQTRELTGVALAAKLGPAWFARWLPTGASWTTAEFTATAEGPLAAPRHTGSLKLINALWPPLHPFAVDASWQGAGSNLEISARAHAGSSTLEFAGTLDPHGLQLNKLQFVPGGRVVWQLTAPAQLAWTPTWQIDSLQLTGPDSQLTLKGKSGADGFIDLSAAGFDSAWLQDWVTVSGPGWRLHTLQTTGRIDGGVLIFDAALSALIEMSPQPAQLKLVAHGDARGIELKEFKVVDGDRVLTQATGRLPLVLVMEPAPHLLIDEVAPLELSASTEPDSPLWATLAAYTGLELTKPTAKLNLKGTLRQPTGELQAGVAQLALSPGRYKFSLPEFTDLTLALQFGRELVTLTTFSAKLDGQAVQAGGRLSMDDGGWQQLWREPAAFDWKKAEAKVEIPDADLAPLARRFPNFVAAQGRLTAHAELAAGGKISDELHLADAASRPFGPLGALQGVQVDLTLAKHLITVRTLTGKLGGEPVTLDGSVTLVPGAAPHLALGLKGTNLPLVRNTGLLLRTDLDLHASTDAAGLTRLSGAITVRDCLVMANINLRTLLPTGRRGVTRQPPYFAVLAEPFHHWPLAVDVRAPGSVRVRTTAYNGTASAHFQLSGTLGEPRAVGELTVDQGQVLFPFATFKVTQGTVRLREADPFHAVVNLNATSQRRDYQLRLEMTGELPAPNVTITPTPALGAADVLLLVMTGQAPAGATPYSATNSSPRLALLGAYLSRGFFQNLGFSGEDRLEISAGEHISRAGRETYEFEYKLGKRWSLQGEYDEFDAYNAGVKWRVYTQEGTPLEKK